MSSDAEIDRPKVAAALRDAGGNIGKAAHKLGVSRRTLQNRMRLYGMPRGKAGRRFRKLHYSRGGNAAGWLAGAAALAGGVYVFSRTRKA